MSALRPAGAGTFVAGRNWRETLQFATHANACAGQRRTSAPSRAGILIWRAAGLLRRQRCGPVRAADPPTAPEPLSPAAGRAPNLCPDTTGGRRCIATLHRETPWTVVLKESRLRVGEPRFRRCFTHRVPVAQQLPDQVIPARVGSARRSPSTTSTASLNIDSEYWFGGAPMTRSELCERVAVRSSRCQRPRPPPRSALSPSPLPTRLPKERPSLSPDSTNSRHGPARLTRGAIPAPASPSPSTPPGFRPSRP